MKRPSCLPRNLKLSPMVSGILLIATIAFASKGPASSETVQAGQALKPTTTAQGAVRVSGQLDRSRVLQGGDGAVRMKLTLEGKNSVDHERSVVPTDLFVVLDRSGSMQGEKLERAKLATLALIDQLEEYDRFGLITYESGVRTDIDLALASRINRERWRSAVTHLNTAGGTNMSAGLDRAHRLLLEHRLPNRAARVVLLSDGQANEGDASIEGLTRRAMYAAKYEYVLSTVGIGQGFNESLMTALANSGTGNFYYVAEYTSLAGIFSDEFKSARETVASGIAVVLETPANVMVEDAAGYVLERFGNTSVFRPGSLFAGQKRTIWVTYRLPTDGAGDVRVGGVRVEFTENGDRSVATLGALPAVATVRSEKEFHAGIDKKVWGDAVAIDELNHLRMKVGVAIQSGNREAAKREISAYRAKNQRLNSVQNAPSVVQSLQEAQAMDKEVDEAFSGSNSSAKRNRASKKFQSKGFDGRRGGSKR